MLLIAIKSCQRDRINGFHDAIRQTWGKDLPESVALRFFMGGEHLGLDWPLSDEVYLETPDDYRSLPFKTKQIAKYFLETKFEKVFLCDNDTYVDIPGLLKYPYQDYDYAGRFSFWPKDAQLGTTFRYDDGQGNIHDPCHAWASGGYGYFLSKKAAQLVADMTPVSWAEDLSVGQVLGPLVQSKEIKAANFEYSNQSVWHIVKNLRVPFTPQRIHDYHHGKRA